MHKHDDKARNDFRQAPDGCVASGAVRAAMRPRRMFDQSDVPR